MMYLSIQDLKKQTALRLAQEQQQKQGYMPDTDRNRPLQPLGEHQFPPSGQPPHPVVPGHAAGRYGYAGPRVGVSPSTAEVPNQGYQCPNPPQVAHFNQTGPFNGHGHPTAAAPYDYTENRQLSPRSMQNQNHVRHEVWSRSF